MTSDLSCRFYKARFPDVENVVMVNIRSIAEMGAYVELLEYQCMEGMILLSELSRRRIRSINKLIRVGRMECVVVIRVDREKGYIDLSKRRVSPDEVKKCEERYIKAKTVHSIVLHTAEVLNKETNEELEELMEKTAWYFDDKYKGQGMSFEAFRSALNDPSLLDQCNLSNPEKEALLNSIRHRLEPKKAKIRADIEVSCYAYEGIDAVKEALRAGINASKDTQFSIKVNLIAPPVYVVTTIVLDREGGLKVVRDVVDAIRDCITAKNGHFCLKMEPKIVTDFEDAELSRRLADLERVNAEVDGDDDTSESDGELSESEADDEAALRGDSHEVLI